MRTWVLLVSKRQKVLSDTRTLTQIIGETILFKPTCYNRIVKLKGKQWQTTQNMHKE